MYVVCPSEWGQQACDKLLGIARAWDLHVTLIVPRKDEEQFQTRNPAIQAWQRFASVRDACDKLAADGHPIDYVYDDFLDAVRAQMLRERQDGYGVIVYITSDADKHIEYAKYFNGYSNRILIEKPYSAFYEDVSRESVLTPRPGTEIVTAEHYLFRPGVTAAWSEPGSLRELLGTLWGKNISYEFRFDEEAAHDHPNKRLNAYKDGSILDIAVVHGLGPLCRLLLPACGFKESELASVLDKGWTWTSVAPFSAADSGGNTFVATLAETAVELQATLKLEHGGVETNVDISLRSVKGAASRDRYFKFSSQDDDASYCKVSLGDSGYEIRKGSEMPYTHEGGGSSDAANSARTGAANAQAAMLLELLKPDLSDRFMPLELTRTVLRLAIRAQSMAAFVSHQFYRWGKGIPSEIHSAEVEDPELLIDTSADSPYEMIDRWLGLRPDSKPAFRFVSFLGDEGDGNARIARSLETTAAKAGALHRLVKIPRDECWASRADSESEQRSFSLEIVLQQFAQYRLQPEHTSPLLLILNGVDRLSAENWKLLVHALNSLPTQYRVCLLSNQASRTAGLVVRTQKVMPCLAGSEDDSWLHAPGPQPSVDLQGLDDWIAELAQGNITLSRQLRAYLEFVTKSAGDGPAMQMAEDHLAALELPQPVATNPVALMERVSRLLLAELKPGQLAAVRTLALLDTPDRELIDTICDPSNDDLLRALFELRTDDKSIKLFPRVRYAALTANVDDLEVERDRLHRCLLMRRLHRRMKAGGRLDDARALLSLLGSADLSTLSFRKRAFGDVAHDVVKALADARDGSGTKLILRCINLLVAERGRMTNLNLKSRAELSSQSGIMMFDRDDGSPAAMARLRTGYEIARYHHQVKPDNDEWASVLLSTGGHLLLMHLHLGGFWTHLMCGTLPTKEPSGIADAVVAELEKVLKTGSALATPGNRGRASRALSLYYAWRKDVRQALNHAENAMVGYEKSGDGVRVCRSYRESSLLRKMLNADLESWPTPGARQLFETASGRIQSGAFIDVYLELLDIADTIVTSSAPSGGDGGESSNVSDTLTQLAQLRMRLEITEQSVFLHVVEALKETLERKQEGDHRL